MSKSSTAAAPVAAAWSFDGHVALTLSPGVRLDLTHPSAGLETPGGDHLLGLDLGVELPPIDRWARGDDVTATWESGDQRALRATGLWRHIPTQKRNSHPGVGTDATGVSAWELIASATTARLRSDSALAVVSDLHADSVLTSAWGEGAHPTFTPGVDRRNDAQTGIVLVRRTGGPSVLVMLHPSDHQAVTIERHGSRIRIGCWLFPTGVEKGVLLRSRVLAAIGPADGDLGWSADVARWFAASPPDLAT